MSSITSQQVEKLPPWHTVCFGMGWKRNIANIEEFFCLSNIDYRFERFGWNLFLWKKYLTIFSSFFRECWLFAEFLLWGQDSLLRANQQHFTWKTRRSYRTMRDAWGQFCQLSCLNWEAWAEVKSQNSSWSGDCLGWLVLSGEKLFETKKKRSFFAAVSVCKARLDRSP